MEIGLTPLPTPEKRRHLRESLGLSQEQLAARINVTRDSVRRWENGGEPKGATRTAYAKALADIEDYLDNVEVK